MPASESVRVSTAGNQQLVFTTKFWLHFDNKDCLPWAVTKIQNSKYTNRSIFAKRRTNVLHSIQIMISVHVFAEHDFES